LLAVGLINPNLVTLSRATRRKPPREAGCGATLDQQAWSRKPMGEQRRVIFSSGP